MHYDFVAIAESEAPAAVSPAYQHLVSTYVSESNKTASMWKAVPEDCLDFKPHERTNTIRKIFEHQLLSERRFFGQFVGTHEPPAEDLLPAGENPAVEAYIQKLAWLCKLRLPQIASGTPEWWHQPRPFFGGEHRERIWIFWRRVLHTCHHRTQVQTWLRLAGRHVPAIYGPSGDVTWENADATYSVDAANRGGAATQA